MWWGLAIVQAAQQLSKEVVAVSRARQLLLSNWMCQFTRDGGGNVEGQAYSWGGC
jgi:hypothetical protein